MNKVTDVFSVASSHPCLVGHFPHRPIVPAVLILEAIMLLSQKAWTNIHITEVAQIKFLVPLLPEQVLSIHLKKKASKIDFEGFIQQKKSVMGCCYFKQKK